LVASPRLDALPGLAEARIAELELEREGLRNEVESWRWEATNARRELTRLQGSRLWRLAHVYWAFRRRLRGWLAPWLKPQGGASPTPAVAVRPGLALPVGFPRAPRGKPDVVILTIIDWDFRFQRPQQIAAQFGRAGHRVFYLSTSRFLPPEGPAWSVALKASQVLELCLRSRRPLDVYAGRLEAADVAVLEESLAELLQAAALGDVLLIVHLPFWWPLALRLRERFGWRVVYDCMDEWQNFPGIGRGALGHEGELVLRSDLVLTTSQLLFEKWEPTAGRLALVPNGVDLDHYRRYYEETSILGAVSHPVIGYFGALASWVDAGLLKAIAERFRGATLVLAGGVFDLDLSALEALPNVRLLGQLPYEDMPRLLWQFDVCLIPFAVNSITQATNPVKLYEYFSSGKPVVASRLAELEPFADVCYLAEGRAAILAALERALAEPADDPRRERRRRIAEESDWKARRNAILAAAEPTFPLVSILIVTYGGLPLTRRCLDSLLGGETWPRFEILVVDNDSPDETRDYLRSLADPRVRVLLQERNLGFPRGCNLALAEARGEIVVFLNNDTIVPPGLLGRLVRPLQEDPQIGLLCATTNFCGNEARVEAGYDDLSGLPGFAAQRAREHSGRLFDLPVAALYCVAARRAVLEAIGPLDEAFGIGMFEDDDYSLRTREAGYRVACAEDAYVHHVGQGTFQHLSADEYQSLWQRNQAYYEAKWKRRWKPHALRSGVAPVLSKIGAG
jgi:GT2 family glycosyltransferase/glycosyltransferase involved in cell wall biosynthesis